MQQLRGDGGVGGQEAEHGGHVGRDHPTPLGDAAQGAGSPVRWKVTANSFLRVSVVMMASAAREPPCADRRGHQLRQPRLDGLQGKGRADDAGGGHQHVRPRRFPAPLPPGPPCPPPFPRRRRRRCWQCRCCRSRPGRNRAQMPLGHRQRRALDHVLGVDGGGGRRAVGHNQRQIPLAPVLPDAAVDARAV